LEGRNSRLSAIDEIDEIADADVSEEGVAEGCVRVETITVPAADSSGEQETRLVEVANNRRDPALGHPEGGGDLADCRIRMAGKIEERNPVVGHQPPGSARIAIHGAILQIKTMESAEVMQ
jgi:hypothetical protein